MKKKLTIGKALIIAVLVVYTLFLFRRRIFKKKYQDRPVVEWMADAQ